MSSADPREAIRSSMYQFHNWPLRYGSALLAVTAAALTRYLLGIVVDGPPPFILFYPTIMFVALLGGFGPGFFATLLSAASAEYFFIDPRYSFAVAHPRDIVGLVLFGAMAIAMSAMGGLFRKRADRLQEFEKAVEGVEELIVVVDRDYRYVIANCAFLQYRSIRREDLIGRHISEILSAELFETTVKEKLDECFQGKIVQFEVRTTYPSLGERDIFISYFPVEGTGGIERVACVLQDITERKEGERSLKLFRTLIDQSNDAVEVVDPETLRFLDVNEKCCKDLGYTREELLSMSVFDINPGLNESTRATVVEKLRGVGSLVQDGIHRRKDGSTFPMEASLRLVQLERTYVVVFVRDISKRRKSEESLRESEDRYRDLVEHSETLVCTHDLEGRFLSVNPAAARTLGYEVAEVLKMTMRELVAPEFREQFEEYLRTMKTTGSDQGYLCVLTRAGQRRVWEYNNSLRTEGVASPVVRGMARDVTERKETETALRRSEQSYRLLFERNMAGVVMTGSDGRVRDCNHACARMFGYDNADEFRGQQISDFYVDPAERELLLTALSGQVSFTNRELELRRKGGEKFWVAINSSLIGVRKDGELIQSTLMDMTDRKRTQEALRRREEDYRRFVAQSSEGIFRQDMDAPVSIHLPEDELVHHILVDSYLAECNDAMAQMYGMPAGQEFVGKRLTETLDPNDPRNIELTREYIRSGFHMVDRESHETDMHGNAKVFRNSLIGIVENGLLVRTWGIQRDVTEQVRAESARAEADKALRKSEEHFRFLVEQASDGIFIADAQGKYLDVNTAGTEMLGRTRAEMLELTIADLIVPEDLARIEPEVARFAGGATARSEWTFRRKDGSTFPGEVCGKRLPDGRLQGIVRDITERRLAEDAVRESEARERARANELQTVLDTLPIPVLISHDPDCREITTNRAGAEYLRLPPGSNISLSGPPEHRPRFRFVQNGAEIPRDQLPMQRAAATGLPVRDFSSKIILADGTEKYELGNSAPLLDEAGKVRGAVAAAMDITERIQAEEALRRNEKRFRVALKDSPITVFNQDCDLRYTWIYNPQTYWQQDAIGKTDEEIIGATKAAGLVQLKRRVLKTGVALREEVAISYGGKRYAFDVTIEPLFDADGKVVGITGASMDIARLRELSDRLQDARDKLAQEKSYLESEIQSELGFKEIIGRSPALWDVLKKARVVAPTGSTVLLLGETGTGKELVARSVHALSDRHDKTFIKLNCAAVPSGLLESELFGHEKGAFTGAVSQKIGRIELADKGTLFLDEIGELPLELQPKLLRVLQDREFERLGGNRTLHVDVRIISATNRNLQQDIVDKNFREDLFYRLNVFPIELPPLRQRRSDIPMLVQHFVNKHAKRMGRHIETIPSETLDVLQKWNWPGNIRELENMIERMVILSKDGVLADPPAELEVEQEFPQDNLDGMEREHIIRILRESSGVLSGSDGAANRLGIKRTTLQSMLKRMGIDAHEFRRATGTFGG